jgi:hypothetical protein
VTTVAEGCTAYMVGFEFDDIIFLHHSRMSLRCRFMLNEISLLLKKSLFLVLNKRGLNLECQH